MTYQENKNWKAAEKDGDLKKAVEELFEELTLNHEAVEAKPPSKRRHVVRTLYYSVAYKRYHIINASEEKLQQVLKELKVIRSYMKDEMKKIK